MSVVMLRKNPQAEEKKVYRRAGRIQELERQIERMFLRLRLAVVLIHPH